MVTCVDDHLFTHRYLSQQLSAPQPYIPFQDRISVLCGPHDMIFTVPHCMRSTFILLHLASLPYTHPLIHVSGDPPPGRLKAWGLRIPYLGTLNILDCFFVFVSI